MLYSEIIAVCSQIHTKHINTMCGQNVELLNFEIKGEPRQQQAPKSWWILPTVRVQVRTDCSSCRVSSRGLNNAPIFCSSDVNNPPHTLFGTPTAWPPFESAELLTVLYFGMFSTSEPHSAPRQFLLISSAVFPAPGANFGPWRGKVRHVIDKAFKCCVLRTLRMSDANRLLAFLFLLFLFCTFVWYYWKAFNVLLYRFRAGDRLHLFCDRRRCKSF
jgi:hypothetical protein